ncbi:hypothetical protein KR038_003750 [Drosophila bunnanda]|nr:hypothetical protein KR038_003750 [Drosophila bunnanda]
MVRRRLLSSSAKQASMTAYQNFWQQPQPQSPLVASMPQYWHSMCHKLGGAPSLSPSRRQLGKQPREAEQQQQHLPHQRDYQTMWGRCCGTQGTLLKPGALMPAFPPLGYRQVPTRPVATLPPQRSFQYQQGNLISYPAAVQMHQMSWHRQQQQQHQQQQQQQQQQHQQQPQYRPVPVGILKKPSQLDSCGVHHAKRVTIKAPARFQPPVVEPIKPKPEAPRRPSKRMRQHVLRREQQRMLQHQIACQKQLQKEQQEQKEQQKQQRLRRRLLRRQALQKEQHRLELERVQQQLQQHRLKQQLRLRETDESRCRAQKLLEKFNFGKFASGFLENPDADMCVPQLPTQSHNRHHNFSYQEKPEAPRKRVKTYAPRSKDPLDLENKCSTITLTTEQSQTDWESAKTPNRSGTSLVDKATNTQIGPLGDLLRQVPLKCSSDTGKGSRKINISELLRSEQVKGLNADPICQSLMQLVTVMCESKEKQADPDTQSRLRAGSGGDGGGHRKQYSVYLMVASDEEEDEGELLDKSRGNSRNIIGDEWIRGEQEEFSQRCGNAYQEEYPRLGRRKRTRKCLSSRLDDLDCLSSGPLPLLPMRRPLHWPKPDYSKLSQGRANRSRTSSRVRSRSSSRQVIPMRSPRSVSSVLDPKSSWKLWEDLPMTAKTLNKAYSRHWSVSGGQSCTKF